jgi:hypothetical protein
MSKLTLTLIVALTVGTASSYATDTKPKAKQPMKCSMGACCKKPCNKAAMLKAKPAKAAEVKKA